MGAVIIRIDADGVSLADYFSWSLICSARVLRMWQVVIVVPGM